MPTPSLATKVAGIEFSTCVYNASGPRTGSSAAMAKIAASQAGGVLAKSATLEKQNGNPLPRTWHDSSQKKVASLNSEGLPNNGIEYYISTETIKETMESATIQKPYMVSISGKTLLDNLQMMEQIEVALGKEAQIAALELNLACPNVIGKPIIAYDFAQLETVLKEVCNMPLVKKIPLGLKLPPYMDGPHFVQAANIINKHKGVVRYCASINTIGNAFAVDMISEMPVISSNEGFAGLSGPAVKFTALANVTKMRKYLDPSIDVIGVGGVESGQDAFELILCGASAVQVGTCHWIEGPKCFDRICEELSDIMRQKGYKSIDDFKGKLKPWSKEGAALSREERKKKDQDGDAISLSKSSTTNTRDVVVYVNYLFAAIIAFLLADKLGYL